MNLAEFKFTSAIQRKILAMLWTDDEYYPVYRSCIKPSYFSRAVDSDLCRLIMTYWDKYDKPPTQTVLLEEVTTLVESSASKQKLEKQYFDAVEQMAETELFEYEYLREHIIEFGKRQAMSEAILESADIIQDGSSDDFGRVEDIIQKAQQVGQDVNDIGVSLWDDFEERIRGYADDEDVIERFPTGMPALDIMLKGGLGRTEMGVVLASPGRGKTTMLINLGAAAIKRGFSVVHISFENNEKQVMRNYDLCLLKHSFQYVRENLDQSIKALSSIQKMMDGSLYIKKYPTHGADINDIKIYLKRLKNVKGVDFDMVIVDYAAIMRPSRQYNDKRNTIENNYEELRAIGDEFDCAVWTAAQGNRGSLSKRVVTKADLAEAFAIANIADVLAAMCQTIKEKKENKMRLFLDKNRDGVDSILLSGTVDYDAKQITFDKDITDSLFKDDDDDKEEFEEDE